MESSRRSFLKIAGATALGIGAKPVLDAVASAPQGAEAEPKHTKGDSALTAKRWGIVIDTRKFESEADLEPIIEACHSIHNVPEFENKRHEIKCLLAWLAHTYTMASHQWLSDRLQMGNSTTVSTYIKRVKEATAGPVTQVRNELQRHVV